MCGQGTVRWAQLPYWQRVRKVQKTKTPGKTNLPVIAKPENGVGAADTYTIKNADDLKHFFATKPEEAYVCEEFITGDICSYDAISDAAGEPLFESMTVWPPSIADIVNQDLDLAYYTHREVPESLRTLGRKTIKAFGAFNRFVHLGFFRLTKPRKDIFRTGII